MTARKKSNGVVAAPAKHKSIAELLVPAKKEPTGGTEDAQDPQLASDAAASTTPAQQGDVGSFPTVAVMSPKNTEKAPKDNDLGSVLEQRRSPLGLWICGVRSSVDSGTVR